MRKLVAGLVLALSVIVPLLVVAAPAEASPKRSVYLHSSDDHLVKRSASNQGQGHARRHRADVIFKHNWRDNTAPHRHWAKPTSLFYDYNILRQSERGCGIFDSFEGVDVRLYIWSPVTGRAWHSHRWHVPCAHDTTGNLVKGLSDFPRFYYDLCEAPRWKLTVHEKWSLGVADKHFDLKGKLYGTQRAGRCYAARR